MEQAMNFAVFTPAAFNDCIAAQPQHKRLKRQLRCHSLLQVSEWPVSPIPSQYHTAVEEYSRKQQCCLLHLLMHTPFAAFTSHATAASNVQQQHHTSHATQQQHQ
jgi:hypothetical protein